MYTREQASKVKQAFWTTFGRYMAPVLSSEGGKVNWINYKTGIPHLYFRMNATKDMADISIEIMHREPAFAQEIYGQFLQLKPMLEEHTAEQWIWQSVVENEHGQLLSRIYKQEAPVNIFKETDWPRIITFLKPRMISLDAFWNEYKMVFEMLK
ncbi:MAG: DUF4268 domain-containing protein [Chitinophagaceae bacterium]|nr:MAG: DUF4268 domain-containing protein [Chitinophagaceae bacterium]